MSQLTFANINVSMGNMGEPLQDHQSVNEPVTEGCHSDPVTGTGQTEGDTESDPAPLPCLEALHMLTSSADV